MCYLKKKGFICLYYDTLNKKNISLESELKLGLGQKNKKENETSNTNASSYCPGKWRQIDCQYPTDPYGTRPG